MRGQEGRELRSGRREGRRRDEGKERDVGEEKEKKTRKRKIKSDPNKCIKILHTCSCMWFLRRTLCAVCFMHAGGREGRALLGNAEGTWGPGGSEWMTKFGLKGHTNIHLLPAIKQGTQ